MSKHTYFTRKNVFLIFVMVLVIWIASAIIFDGKVKRSDLSDDSIVLILGTYRFKVPVNYLYSMLLENELAKKKYGITERKYKKVKEVDYFSISVAYPDMKPMTIADDKPGFGNKIRIYLSNDGRTIPYRKSAAAKTIERSFTPGIVPDGFDSTEVLKFEDYSRDGKPSIGDYDRYFYKGDLIYMRCPRENTEHTPPSPSCKIHSGYKNLEISASFSNKFKYDFIKIHTMITELFQSFELQPKNLKDANIF